MSEKLYRYRWAIILAVILICMWGWYFLIYSAGEKPIEDYIWYKSSDQQKFLKFKNFADNEFLRQGYNYQNYIDTPMYDNYKFFLSEEDNIFKIVGENDWKEEVDGRGYVHFYQKLVIFTTFDLETKEYVIQAQAQSKYNVPREDSKWHEWDVGNDKITVRCTEEQLEKDVFDVSNQANKLDNLVNIIFDKLNNMFHFKAF